MSPLLSEWPSRMGSIATAVCTFDLSFPRFGMFSEKGKVSEHSLVVRSVWRQNLADDRGFICTLIAWNMFAERCIRNDGINLCRKK